MLENQGFPIPQANIADGARPISVRYFGRQPHRLKTFLSVQHMLQLASEFRWGAVEKEQRGGCIS
jgi:hypothetical protein